MGIVQGPVKWEDLDENTSYEGGFLEQREGRTERLTLNNESMGSKRD